MLQISRNPFSSGQTRQVIRNEYEYDVEPAIVDVPIPFDEIKALFAHRPELRVD